MILRNHWDRRALLAGMASLGFAGCANLSTGDLSRPGQEANDVSVTMTTSLGKIGILVNTSAAPKTSTFFLKLVDDGLFDGRRFWRSGHIHGDERRGLFIEGGPLDRFVLGERPLPPTIAQSGLPVLSDWETTGQSGLDCKRGSVFLGRDILGDGSAIPEIVIATANLPEFEEGGGKSPGNLGFPIFGGVKLGMDVVDHIAAGPREGASPLAMMAGQILSNPIEIENVTRHS